MAERISGADERGPSTSSWVVEHAKLRFRMIKGQPGPGRDRVVLANFVRLASESPPRGRGGVNFENTYVSISSPCESDPFVCEHAPNSPGRS